MIVPLKPDADNKYGTVLPWPNGSIDLEDRNVRNYKRLSVCIGWLDDDERIEGNVFVTC